MQKAKVKLGRPAGSRTFDPDLALGFGIATRECRLSLGYSQEHLSNLAQVERSHMGKIERGEHIPNLILILKIAKALAIKPGKLVDRALELSLK